MPLTEYQKAFLQNNLVTKDSVIDPDTGDVVDWDSLGGSIDGISDVPGLQAALDAKQPLDSDLTSIAALSTTSYGRSLLALANAAAGQSALGLGELSYVERTTGLTPTATTGATAETFVTAAALTFNGTEACMIEFFSNAVGAPTSGAGHYIVLWLYDGSTQLGEMAFVRNPAAATMNIPVLSRRRLVPSAGSHTYSIRASISGGSSGGNVAGGSGGAADDMPAYIRITRA